MQDQLVKKLKDSLNKSSESNLHQSNQSQGGLNNMSINVNSNTQQNNAEALNPAAMGNYLNNKIKMISQGSANQVSSQANKQKASKQSIAEGNHQDPSNSNLTNKLLTQSIKEYFNESGSAQDASLQLEYLQKLQEFNATQKCAIKSDNEGIEDNCERLQTKLDEDYDDDDDDDIDDEEDNRELLMQQEFAALIEHERQQQEIKLQSQTHHKYSDEQIQELNNQQAYILQQQQLAGYQPGDFRIEIQNRFFKSDCNRTFKFPRKLDRENRKKYNYETEYQSSNDSSLVSVDGVTVYNLHAQNMKNYQREYMQMQEQASEQLDKFKQEEQLRLQKEEQEIIEKERLSHQLRQQKIIQQQVYVQHQYEKYSQEKKNEQINQLRDQLQKQQTNLLQIKKSAAKDTSQIIKTEAYDSENAGNNQIYQQNKNQQPPQKQKNCIDQSNQFVQQVKLQNDNGQRMSQNKNDNSFKKTKVEEHSDILKDGMKQNSSAEKQNSKQAQLQKFKNMLINKQANQPAPSANARRMKTEGNDKDSYSQNQYNLHHHLHTQHHEHIQQEDIEEDETIENFEDALLDGSDNDSGEIARLDDIRIQSYKQTASPPQKNQKFSNQIAGKMQPQQDTSNGKNYKNLLDILEKNSKTAHSRQSTSVSNGNQIGNASNNLSQNGQGHQKKGSQNQTLQTVQIQIQQQAAAAAAAATIIPSANSLSKNTTYKQRPTTSQQNHAKNLYSSQNVSINQQASNRNTLQPPDNQNSSKLRQSSKTSHSHYEGNPIVLASGTNGHAKKSSGTNLNYSIDAAAASNTSKQQSLAYQHQLQQYPGQVNSRKRSTSNKNNNSININASSIANTNKLSYNSNTQKYNIPSATNQPKQLENFKVDNLKQNQVRAREEKAPSKAPSSQQHMMNLLNTGSMMNSNTNNSFQMTKNLSMNNGASNKVNSQTYQNAAKLKGRNANSFHQNISSNMSSIHTSQTTNFNNKSTIVSNYSINSNSKKKLLSNSSSTILINAHSHLNNSSKNDSKIKQAHSNNHITSIINANININNLNPTNHSKVRMSTNSNLRESVQSQKGNPIGSRVQTEPSNLDDDFELNYLQTRLSTLTKIPSKQSLLNNKSTTRRKENSGSKVNLRDQLLNQQQNLMNPKQQQQQQQQPTQSEQYYQGLMINNAFNNIQQKSEEHMISQQNQQIGTSQAKYSENLVVKNAVNQQNLQIHSNLRSTNEQSTSDLNDQNKINTQSFDQIQKIKDYLKLKSVKYPNQSGQGSMNQNQFQQINQVFPGQHLNQQQQQVGQMKEHYPPHNIQQQQIGNQQHQQNQQFQPHQQYQQLQQYQQNQQYQQHQQNQQYQQQQQYQQNQNQQQQHNFANLNQKGDNQLLQQYNSQFNSSLAGQPQQNTQHYYQKQIR